MSHVASIELEIRDLDALAAACEPLGLELVRGVKTYKWYGRSVGDSKLPDGFTAADLGKCEHVIRVKGNEQAYEIGLVARRDGKAGFAMMWDIWREGYGMVAKVGGEQCDKLRQNYACEVAVRVAKRQGFRVTKRTVRTDGSIEVQVQR